MLYELSIIYELCDGKTWETRKIDFDGVYEASKILDLKIKKIGIFVTLLMRLSAIGLFCEDKSVVLNRFLADFRLKSSGFLWTSFPRL